jgi:DNA-binding beta-propeller fold protein YncE
VDLFDSGSPTFIAICRAPSGVALSRPDGARAFAACYGEDALAVVDLNDPYAEAKLIQMGPGAGPPDNPTYGPYDAILAPDGSTVAICNTSSRDVRFFDVATETMLDEKTLKTSGAPYSAAFTPDGKRLYVVTQAPDALLVLDVENGAELASKSFTTQECERPHALELHGDVTALVVCEGDGTSPGRVAWVDAITLETVFSTEVGLYPAALVRAGVGAP